MHALKDLSLTGTASAVFSFSDIDTHIENIKNAETPADKQTACMKFFMTQQQMPSYAREELCAHLTDWHAQYLSTAEHFSDAPYILRSLNHSLSAIGCEAVGEGSRNRYSEARVNLHQALLDRAVDEIRNSRSGCLMDMYAKTYITSLPQIGMRFTTDAKSVISAAVEEAPGNGHGEEWKTACLRAINMNVYNPAPQRTMQ